MKSPTRASYLIVVLLLLSLLAASCAGPAATTAPQPTTAAEKPTELAPATEALAATEEPAPTEEQVATEAPATGEVARSEVFVYAHPTTFPNLDPAISYSNDSVVMSNCYETLTFYNPPGSQQLLSPKLATEWSSNSDATEWTFKLREGVKFTDGEPLDAAAVKGAIENTKKIATGAAYIWDAVDKIDVVDPMTVKFTLKYPAPLDLIASAGYAAWIYSPKAYQEKGTDWFNAGNCAGTGPYTIESYEQGTRLVMTRNDNYWGGWKPGQFKKVVYELITDPTVLQQKIESGEADFTYQVPPDNLPALKNNPDLKVYTDPSIQNLLGFFNTKKPPLDKLEVRQALSYAFPYETFVKGVLGDRGVQAVGPIPSTMWGHSDTLPQYDYNLDKAKELLTKAGYPDGGFKLLMTYVSTDLDEQQVGELWKAELAKLGIDLELQPMDWNAQWDLGKSDPAKAQDVFVMYWWPDYMSPYSFLYSIFHSQPSILFNLAYYDNKTFDTTIDKGNEISGVDKQKASDMFVEGQKTLIDDAVAAYFYDVVDNHIARTYIQGYVDNPAYPHVVFVYDLSR